MIGWEKLLSATHWRVSTAFDPRTANRLLTGLGIDMEALEVMAAYYAPDAASRQSFMTGFYAACVLAGGLPR